MKKIFLIICLSVSIKNVFGQITIPQALQTQLVDKQNFYEIRSIVENFYSGEMNRLSSADSVDQKKIFRQRKHWSRWFWYMENRLDVNGNLVDVNAKNFQAVEQLQMNNSFDQATSGDWYELGPSSVNFGYSDQRGLGRVDRIAFHPTDANTIFACTPAGGIWKTTNGGTSWSPLSAFLPSLGVSGFVVSHANTNVLYALTGDGDSFVSGGLVGLMGYHRSSLGVFKSTDGGASWRPTGNFDIEGVWVGYKLIQHPTDANILFAATSKGIFRTLNGGSTWTKILNLNFCVDIEFKTNNPDRIYVSGSNNKVYYSTDGGDNWLTPNMDVTYSSANRIEIAVSPANSSYVYLLMGSSTGFYRFYKSTNSGVDYTMITDGDVNILGRAEDGDDLDEQVMYDLTMTVSYNNINTLYTGGINIWKSTDGGASYTNSSHWVNTTPSKFVHADIHHLIINPLNNYLYAATDGGVFRSTDGGVNWNMISTQLRTSQYYNMASCITTPSVMLAGAQDNGVHRFEASGNVYTEAGGDGFDVEIDQLDFSNHYFVRNTSIFKTNNHGVTIAGITPGSAPGNFFPSILVGGDFNMLFAGYRDAAIMRSTNGGNSWTSLPASLGNWCMATNATNSSRIYAAGGDLEGDNGSFKRSDDEGDSWTSVWPTGGHISSTAKITDITVSQNYSGRVWITIGGYNGGAKVLYSNDAGASWSNISGSLPDVAVNCVLSDAADNVYIGTDIGVFYRGVSHTDWTPYFTGMPRVPVTKLVMGIAYIRAATFGRGIWQSSLYTSCAANLTLNSDMTGRRFYQASTSITSTAILNGGAGTEVSFKAGSFIQLLPGFESLGGGSITAYLGPCNNGVPLVTSMTQQASSDNFANRLQSEENSKGFLIVKKKNNTVSSSIKIYQPGEYTVKVFDLTEKKYIATSKLNCTSAGIYKLHTNLDEKAGKFLRADLFKDNDLIFMQKFEN